MMSVKIKLVVSEARGIGRRGTVTVARPARCGQPQAECHGPVTVHTVRHAVIPRSGPSLGTSESVARVHGRRLLGAGHRRSVLQSRKYYINSSKTSTIQT
jgi:hypothetical protein